MSDAFQRLAAAAKAAAARRAAGRRDPEPSLGVRLGQIGVLGWMIVGPGVLGLFAGRWLDETLNTGVTFTAALIFLGLTLGLWFAYRWMMRP